MSEKTESTQPAEVIVLSTDEPLRKEMQHYADWYQSYLQEAYITYVALGLGEITLAELDRYNAANAERLVREKIYDSSKDFKALPLNREKVLDLVELPPTVAAFKAAMEQLRQFTSRRLDAQDRGKVPSVGHFEIQKGAVVAKASLAAWIDTKTQDRLTHPKQIAAYQEAQKLARQIKDFEEQYGLTVIKKPGDEGIFTRGVLVKEPGFYGRETTDYTDILLNKLKIKSISTNE